MTKAEELAKRQREISISEFFEKNRHLLGYDNKIKALLMIVKEAVDNALDACEEANVLPDIHVSVKETGDEKYEVVVKVGPDTVAGSLESKLGIQTNIARMPVWQVRVHGHVEGIEAIPTTIHFGVSESGPGEVALLTLRGPYEFEVKETTIDIPGFSVLSDKVDEHKQFIRISKTAAAPDGSVHGILNVTMVGRGKEDVISVPVHGLIQKTTGS